MVTVYVGVKDVEVRQVFTEAMFQELQLGLAARRDAAGAEPTRRGGTGRSRAGQEAAGVHAGPTHQHRARSRRRAAVQTYRRQMLPGRPLLHR